MIPFYIIHWNKLKDRKKYLDEKLSGQDVTFVDDYDRDTITEELINKWYRKEPKLWHDRCYHIYKEVPGYRELRKSEICNYLSHLKIINDIIEKNQKEVLVLDDDVRFKDTFFQKFDTLLEKTPQDYDIIYLGSSFTVQILDVSVAYENVSPIVLKSGQEIYEKINHPRTRCGDYILSAKAAKKLKEAIDCIVLPQDYEFSYWIKKLDLKVYWWEPGLVFQGTQCGIYNSSIER